MFKSTPLRLSAFRPRHDETPEAGTAAGASSLFANIMGTTPAAPATPKPAAAPADVNQPGAAAPAAGNGQPVTPAANTEDNVYSPENFAAGVGIQTPEEVVAPEGPSQDFLDAMNTAIEQSVKPAELQLDPKKFMDAAKNIDFVGAFSEKATELFGEQGPEVSAFVNSIMQAAFGDMMVFSSELVRHHGSLLTANQNAITTQSQLRSHVSNALGDTASEARVNSALALAETIRSSSGTKLPLADIAAGAVRMLGGVTTVPGNNDKPDGGRRSPDLNDIMSAFERN